MKMSDCRTQSPPMRVERLRARRVWVALACAAVFVVAQLLPSKTAYAADDNWKSVWNHQTLDGGEQYIVGADNEFSAAAYVLGFSPSAVKGWDSDARAILSGTANPFSQLAGSMVNCDGWNEDGYVPQLEAYFGTTLWANMQQYRPGFGSGTIGVHVNPNGVSDVQLAWYANNAPDGLSCYAINTTADLVTSARDYVNAVLGGGGGAGKPEIVGNHVDAKFDALYSTQTTGQLGNAGTPLYYELNGKRYIVMNGPIIEGNSQYVTAPEHLEIGFNLPTIEGLDYSQYDFYAVCILQNGVACRVLILPRGQYTFSYSYTSPSKFYEMSRPTLDLQVSSDYYYFQWKGVNPSNLSNIPDITLDNLRRVEKGNDNWNFYQSDGNFNYGVYVVSGYTSEEPTVPPTNPWPTPPEPTTPEPPEPPEPTPNPPEPDPPANPTPYTPPTYTPVGVTAPTDTTDVIPWLRAILDQLKAIQTDMANHCQHIQDAISENADRIIETISSRVEWMADVLDGMFETLTDNICDTLRWLARQMQFDQTEPYNDTSLLYWIRKIYARLGNQPVNPINPAEPGGAEKGFDFWEWLIGMLSSLIGGVLGDASDAVRTLLEGIKDKFPFSIPWDLMGILALLDAPRQTPDLTVTIPAINGWWEPIEFDLDLAPYDDVAAAMRAMAMIWWVAELIKRTNWMLDDVLGSVTTKLIGGPVGKLTGAV